MTLRDWANERFDGELDAKLRQWRDDDDLTVDQVVRLLEDDHDLIVSRETVRRWYQALKVPA